MRNVRARQEEQELKEELLRDKDSVLEHGRHPYGVQPMGNMYADCAPSIRGGLGAFSPVADQAVLDLLEMLDVRQLGLLTCCSRALYVYCHHADLWRSLVLRVYGGNFEFMSNWKDTFGYCFLKQGYKPHVLRKVRPQASSRSCACLQSIHRILLPVPRSTISNDDLSGRVLLMCGQFVGVYSDLLFQPWLCASLGICPEWLERCNIDRRSNLSVEVRYRGLAT
jgi:hypothetical protein